MIAVLVILITAPIGAVAIALSGPRLLKHTSCTGIEIEHNTPQCNEEANVDNVETCSVKLILHKEEKV